MENNKDYNPDVLNCIANLSNDEVFTPPQLVNEMLDLLPQELFSNPEARFLDPFTKSGVFLREIVKRLDVGLASIIPDRQERILHIMHNQIFGIALTELTSLLARRSVYCSKYANSEHSIGRFKTKEGYILYTSMQHSWQNGRCKYCGASKEVFDRGDAAETYAYNFIHTNNPEKFFPNMTFDVIIGNPPYQMNDGGGTGSSAGALYHKFVQQAKKLSPHFLIMIIPSRWMTGGKGVDSFRKEMLEDTHIKTLHDFINAKDCFPTIELEGGVCYFLRDRDYNAECNVYTHQANGDIFESKRYLNQGSDIVIRDANVISILNKVQKLKETSFETLVSKRNPFNVTENLIDIISTTVTKRQILCRINSQRSYQYLKDKYKITRNSDLVTEYKLFVSKADGAAGQIGNPIPARIIGKAEIAPPNTICSETFLCIKAKDKQQAFAISEYMKTKFFRFMVGIRKNKNMTHDTYLFVPLQDFSEPWTDEKLYKKYNLSSEEIAFIESMIRPME